MTEPGLSKLAGPARRALASIGVTTHEHLAEHREVELLALHGVGPKAVAILRESHNAADLSFQP